MKDMDNSDSHTGRKEKGQKRKEKNENQSKIKKKKTWKKQNNEKQTNKKYFGKIPTMAVGGEINSFWKALAPPQFVEPWDLACPTILQLIKKSSLEKQ